MPCSPRLAHKAPVIRANQNRYGTQATKSRASIREITSLPKSQKVINQAHAHHESHLRYNESRHDSYPQFSRSLGTPGTMIPLQITTFGATQPWVINSLRLSEFFYRKSYIKPRGGRAYLFQAQLRGEGGLFEKEELM